MFEAKGNLVSAALWWALFLLGTAVVVKASLWCPAALPITAAATEFSSGRAMRTLEQFTKKPHPVGSAEHEQVKEFLADQLKALGLEVAVETYTGVEVSGHRITAARASNLVGRLKGTANTGAVVLLAHYDTVDRAPGAGDDGGGVAAILETVRALKAGGQLRNDIIVLLTDGEELGLLGARAAAVHDSWLKHVGVMLNFEGRGDRGPSELFETSSGNSNLIREYVQAATYKTGSSLLYTIYKQLPNDTDYTVFKDADVAGLNFAWIRRWETYHSRLDTVANLDQRALQQEGSNALELVRAFGNLDLKKTRLTGAGDEVFFDLFGTWMAHYPGWLVTPLAGLLTVVLAVVLVRALHRRELRAKLLFGSTAVSLLLIVATTLTSVATLSAERLLLSRHMQLGDTPANTWLFVGMIFLSATVWLAIFQHFRKRLGAATLAAGACVLGCVLVLTVALTLPLASYLLFWPLVFATVMLLFELQTNGAGKAWRLTVTWLCAVPMLLLLAPTLYLFFIALFLVPPLAVVCGVLLSFGLLMTMSTAGFLAPSRAALRLPLVAGTVAIALGAALSRPTAQHPEPDSLVYNFDANTGKAQWGSFDKDVDPWTEQELTRSPNQGKLIWPGPVERDALVMDAPTLTLAAPELRLVASEQDRDVRTVQMRVSSPRKAEWLHLQLDPKADVLGASFEGEQMTLPTAPGSTSAAAKGPWAINLYGFGDSGVAITLKVKGGACLAKLTDEGIGLPSSVVPRPENRMAWYGSDYTVITREVTMC